MQPAVTAAVVGGVVSAVISGVLNLLSLGVQYRLNRRNRRLINEDQWRSDTIATTKELRREAMRILRTENKEQVEDLVKDVEYHIDELPREYYGTDLKSKLDSIPLSRNRFDAEEISEAEYRGELIRKTEDTLDEFENSTRSSNTLY